ncbi:MAG TPA: hypothetical protein PK668_10155 [Myxococcota bacterium]|nr:hypothetical protein [Myxococcota bacterium]HRY93471.1 hypothetical protein [Myxococcota bacterium]HSA23359.1 hypothetical protein [Myxococcota bacterium]
MRVERTGEGGLGLEGGATDVERLEGLLQQAGDPASALELLAVREHRAERRSAAALQRVEAQARQAALRQTLCELRSAAGWRRWSGIAGMATQAAQSAINAAGGGENGGSQEAGAASSLVSLAGGACQVALNGKADQDDRAATWMQAESEQRLAEQRSAEEWLREVRAAEGKLLERLEACLRAEHEGRMACLRT